MPKLVGAGIDSSATIGYISVLVRLTLALLLTVSTQERAVVSRPNALVSSLVVPTASNIAGNPIGWTILEGVYIAC